MRALVHLGLDSPVHRIAVACDIPDGRERERQQLVAEEVAASWPRGCRGSAEAAVLQTVLDTARGRAWYAGRNPDGSRPMRAALRAPLTAIAMAVALCNATVAFADEDLAARIAASREAIKSFGGALQEQLKSAVRPRRSKCATSPRRRLGQRHRRSGAGGSGAPA